MCKYKIFISGSENPVYTYKRHWTYVSRKLTTLAKTGSLRSCTVKQYYDDGREFASGTVTFNQGNLWEIKWDSFDNHKVK